ncbi:UNKNOWN [Stylonychia lemnae]|uniref:Uncharacterized protein n=1 Tax=Stylonychia lemnae TaxID=5949 RepID=A0A077ZWT0_STYLE|nr:UNKNOWN [Stylonychia lemnae]|eukprot:CDW74299.1 UNKNOWN [Stylonychia lemnae]
MIRVKRKQQSQGENQYTSHKIDGHNESNIAKENKSRINKNLEESDNFESKEYVHDKNYNNCSQLQANQLINNSNEQHIFHCQVLTQQPSYKQIFSIIKEKSIGTKNADLNKESNQKSDLKLEILKYSDISNKFKGKMEIKSEILNFDSNRIQLNLVNQQTITEVARSLFQKVLIENSRI